MGSFNKSLWAWLVIGSVLPAIGCGAYSEPVDSTMLGEVSTGGTGGSGGAGGFSATTLTFSQGASYTGATDASILKGAPTTKNGAATTCIIDGGASESACALRWSLAAIPAGATILQAQVTLTVSSPSNSTLNVYKLKQRWTEANVTWNKFNSTHLWGIPGAKSGTDRDPVPLASVNDASGQWQFTIPTSVVQAWLPDPNLNDGLLLVDTGQTQGVTFRSSESPNVAEHPMLTVTYR